MGLRLHILQVIKCKYQFLWAPMTCFAAAEVVLGHWGKISSCTRLMLFPTVVLFWTCLRYFKVYSGKVVSQWASRWIARPKVQIIRNIYNDSTSFLCLVLSVLPAQGVTLPDLYQFSMNSGLKFWRKTLTGGVLYDKPPTVKVLDLDAAMSVCKEMSDTFAILRL